MIKLEKYKLTGYKNIREADLSFNNINVIIGPNNAGKSNFIQSISFINFIINTASTDDLEKYFNNGFYKTHFDEIVPISDLFSNEPKDFDISFSFRFINTDTNRIFNYILEIEGKEDLFDISYKIKNESLDAKEINKPGKAESIFKRNGNKVVFGSKLSKTSLFEDVPNYFSVIRVLKLVLGIDNDSSYLDAVNSLNSIVKTPIFYFSNLELLKADNNDRLNFYNGRVVSFELEEEIIKLQTTNSWDIFKEALYDILDIHKIEVDELPSFEDDDKTKRKKHKFLSFYHFNTRKGLRNFSDGTILIIALITKVLSSKNDLFFIEEPENSTHPKALIDLFSFIKSFSENKQFVLTSHSIAILNKTKTENIIIGSVDEEGKSTLYNISNRKELKKRLKQGQINFSDELFFGNLEEEEFE
ncbi:AAA family ATPase [Aquimarina megaterium]|uniref:AAA family ATPase n=1 Tax=Aquimarina megaterium TaxID=1443666 RepID=UPI00047092DE|nr:ATP-binding protein [Aquimarina megaterium]